MPPSRDDVRAMVLALFTLTSGLDRARRQGRDPGALSLLQVIAEYGQIRPSEIASRQQVHPSLVTRQVGELEDAGHVRVTADPADGRSCLVTLTAAGASELRRLQEIGVDRFAEFVRDWEPDEVRALTALLEKLDKSKAALAPRERGRACGRRQRRDT